MNRGIHHDLTFLLQDGEAMHHSVTTSEKQGGVPIVINSNCNKDAIVADYDVEKATETDRYYTNLFLIKVEIRIIY